MRRATPRNPQTGLSLIELMVAMTLGLMITTTLGYILMGSQSTYRTQDASARVQDTGRFALEFIGRQIRSAGRVDISPLASDTDVALGGEAIVKTGGNASNATRLTVRYEAATDCNGGGGEGVQINTIRLDNEMELECEGDGGGPQPFAEEVEELQFSYTSDGINWGGAPAGTVRAVQVCIRVRSAANGVVPATQTLKNCAGGDFTPNPADTRLRRTFTSVFALRNNINALPTP